MILLLKYFPFGPAGFCEVGCGSGVFLGVFLDSFLGVFWTVTFLANLLLNVNILLTLDENLLEKN